MPIQIQDPSAWAKVNSYSLKPQMNEKFINVSFQGNPVGLLTKVGDYFEFQLIDQLPTKEENFGQAPNTGNEIGTDKPHGHYDANTPYLTPGLPGYPMLSRSFGIPGFSPIALDKLSKGTNEVPLSEKASGTGFSERVLDCNYWLPYAAEHYDISRDIRDYVLVPIPAIFSGLPNTNGDSLSLGEMLAFKPEYGMQMYKTFKGQPTHQEHQNKDITKAKGVILESFLRPIKFNRNFYKIVLLLAFDRTKDSILVNQILTGEVNSYSVGFYYTSYSCSICGRVVGKGLNLTTCSHTQMGRGTYKQADGKLAYRKCINGKGFECSAVGTPAFVSAIGPHVIDARKF